MTVHERIFIADDQSVVRDSLKSVIESFGADDQHEVVGEASSVAEVKAAFEGGVKPTVALVDGKFPSTGDGLIAAKIIRKESPQTTIIVFSTDHQEWGEFQDGQWNKHMPAQELIDNLTNLQH